MVQRINVRVTGVTNNGGRYWCKPCATKWVFNGVRDV